MADLDDSAQGDAAEPDLPEVLTPQTLGKMWAASMGMSFAVPADVDALSVTASWGAYTRRKTEDDTGSKRAGLGTATDFVLQGGASRRRVVAPDPVDCA